MEWPPTTQGVHSGKQAQRSTGSSTPSMKSDDSKDRPPDMAEGRSVCSGSVLCDVCSDPAVKTCLTCMASYCMTHVEDHYTSPDLQIHQLQDLHHHSLCQQHHRELEFYCRTDQSAICSRCLLHHHTGHDVIEQTPERTPSMSLMKEGSADAPPPGQIQFVSVQPDSVSLCWSPPEGAPDPHSFKVTWTGAQKHRSLKVTGVALEVTELTPGERYHFTVATLSQDGRQSTCVEGTVYTEVPPPQNLQVDLRFPTASLTWTKPIGVDQVTYLLEICRDEKKTRTIHRDSSHYTITDLQRAADYTISVSTVLSNGRQSKPTSKTFRTGSQTDCPLTLLLLGEKASGKSASGNTILGKKAFLSKTSSRATTIECAEASKIIYGTQIKVIDTPDFFDEDLQQPSSHVMKCRQMCEGGLCVYLLVIQIGRFTEGERDILERLERALHSRIRDRAVILFTYGDDLDQHIDDYVRNTNTHLQELIRECGGRYQVFNNRKRDEQQVEELMGKIAALVKETDGGPIFPEYPRDETAQKKKDNCSPHEQMKIPRMSLKNPVDHYTGLTALSICLLGETGSGKSASGNTILGSDKFPSKTSVAPVTTRCQSASTYICGTQVKVIDTPDFFDDEVPHQAENVKECRQMCEGGLCVYLLVLQIGRFTEGERDILERLERALQTRIRHRAIILFTHGDDLKPDRSIDDYVRHTNTHLQRLIMQCGCRYQVFNNRNTQEAANQKEELIDKLMQVIRGDKFTENKSCIIA